MRSWSPSTLRSLPRRTKKSKPPIMNRSSALRIESAASWMPSLLQTATPSVTAVQWMKPLQRHRRTSSSLQHLSREKIGNCQLSGVAPWCWQRTSPALHWSKSHGRTLLPMVESFTLRTPKVFTPNSLANSKASKVSVVSPDWEIKA